MSNFRSSVTSPKINLMREIIFIAQNTFSSYGYDRSPKMSNFWSSGISLKINLMRERDRQRESSLPITHSLVMDMKYPQKIKPLISSSTDSVYYKNCYYAPGFVHTVQLKLNLSTATAQQ